MASPQPGPQRPVKYFRVRPDVYDRIIGYLSRQRICDAVGLYTAALETTEAVFEEPPLQPGPIDGPGKIVDTEKPLQNTGSSSGLQAEGEIEVLLCDWELVAKGVWECIHCENAHIQFGDPVGKKPPNRVCQAVFCDFEPLSELSWRCVTCEHVVETLGPPDRRVCDGKPDPVAIDNETEAE